VDTNTTQKKKPVSMTDLTRNPDLNKTSETTSTQKPDPSTVKDRIMGKEGNQEIFAKQKAIEIENKQKQADLDQQKQFQASQENLAKYTTAQNLSAAVSS